MATTHQQSETVAYVRWFDSAIYKGDPCQPSDLTGYLDNESAGVLIEEDDEKITLALDRCLDTQDVRLVLCIPKANVRAIQRFKVATSSASSSGRGRKRRPS